MSQHQRDPRPDPPQPPAPTLPGPVGIGGVGGSGTRVVAQLLLDLGYYLGADLNEANDNLWFTHLFKRPVWFAAAMADPASAEIVQALGVFERTMRGQIQRADLEYVARAAVDLSYQFDPDDPAQRWTLPWSLSLARIETFAASRPVDLSGYRGWGWKEPNSHIALPCLCQHFPDLQYILVIRHGLDMCYSANQQQLYNWGPLFGIAVPAMPDHIPQAALNYWIAANRAAIATGTRLLGDRFLVMDYDRLCASPQPEITRLLDFLGIDSASVDTDQLFALPRVPESAGRYRTRDLSVFSADQLAAVRALGFAVE
jgi:hypothetical protein